MKKLIASLMIVVCCLSGCPRAKPENSSANVSQAVTPSPDKTAETNQATQNTPLATLERKPMEEDFEVSKTSFHPNNETGFYLLTMNQRSPDENMSWTLYDNNGVKTQTFSDEYLSTEVQFLDVNFDGYEDAVVSSQEEHTSSQIYLWNPKIEGFEPVTYVGFEYIKNFEIHDGYLLTGPYEEVYGSYRRRRMKWEGSSLVRQSRVVESLDNLSEKEKETALFEYVEWKGNTLLDKKLKESLCEFNWAFVAKATMNSLVIKPVNIGS